MNVQRKLMEVRQAQLRYILAKEKAEQFDAMICSPAPTQGGSGGKSTKDNFTEKMLVKAAAYHEEAEELLRAALMQREIGEGYAKMLVNLTEKEVITRRYIMGQSWETICNTMRYCQRQIMRIHKRALEKLEKMSLNVSKFL